MTAQDYTTTIAVDRPATEVFDEVADPRRWWNTVLEGDTDAVGDEFIHEVSGVHRARIRVVEVAPGERLTWQVVENWFAFVEDETEWVDSRIHFELTEADGTTEIVFTHEGLTPRDACYDVCHDAWTGFIEGSLHDLLESGQGAPFTGSEEEVLQARQSVGVA